MPAIELLSNLEKNSLRLLNNVGQGEWSWVDVPDAVRFEEEDFSEKEGSRLIQRGSENHLVTNYKVSIVYVDDQGAAVIAALDDDTTLATDRINDCSGFGLRLQKKSDLQRPYFGLAHFTPNKPVDRLRELVGLISGDYVVSELAYSFRYDSGQGFEDFPRIFPGVRLHGIDKYYKGDLSRGMIVSSSGGIHLLQRNSKIDHVYDTHALWRWGSVINGGSPR